MELIGKQSVQIKAEQVEVEYFTDPLCCWSWALEPHWRKFITENNESLNWRYRMAGLIPDWKKYHDPVNDIYAAAQMAPYWMQVSRLSGVPVDESIWHDDPPVSSYPACIAVKCAEIQSKEAADIYLQALREAVMVRKKNIARIEILLSIAHELEISYPGVIDLCKFEHNLTGSTALSLFKDDLHAASYRQIGRFPSIIMGKKNKNSILIVGFRPYSVLIEAYSKLQG